MNIQDYYEKAVFIGGDAVALYPSMDAIGTSELVYQAVLNSEVEFKSIQYEWLILYIYLMLGDEKMGEIELSKFIPKRKM